MPAGGPGMATFFGRKKESPPFDWKIASEGLVQVIDF